VFEIAIQAAATTKSTITAMTAADVEPFAPRTAVDETGKAAAPKPAPAETPAATDTSASGATATDGAATPSAAAAKPAADGRTEAPFTITVTVPSPAAAAQFLDDLRKGPRLIAITHSVLTGTAALGSSDATYTLTVDALAFIHTAD
jgi:hypothetical protein